MKRNRSGHVPKPDWMMHLRVRILERREPIDDGAYADLAPPLDREAAARIVRALQVRLSASGVTAIGGRKKQSAVGDD